MLASNGYPGMMAPAMQGFQSSVGGHHPSSHAQYNSPMAAFWQARHHMGPTGATAGGATVNGMPQSMGHQTPVSSAHQGPHQDAKMAEKIVSELQVGRCDA